MRRFLPRERAGPFGATESRAPRLGNGSRITPPGRRIPGDMAGRIGCNETPAVRLMVINEDITRHAMCVFSSEPKKSLDGSPHFVFASDA